MTRSLLHRRYARWLAIPLASVALVGCGDDPQAKFDRMMREQTAGQDAFNRCVAGLPTTDTATYNVCADRYGKMRRVGP